ncbi:MAG TPA: hypothetical protein VLY23_01600 [Candidatus Acidoferrum sp.]|nr:hypothetical protein [Candidatus Acidoferrum sp.]
MRVSKVGTWVSLGTLVVSLLAGVPAYVIFFDKPDLVYEVEMENIPLPKDLAGQLPDTLAIVTVQNIGRRPSVDVEGSVSVGGELIEYQVQGPNPAYGRVLQTRAASLISITCSRLAAGQYPVRISAWYRAAGSIPDVGFSDARGAARRVSSIAGESAKYREAGTGVLGLLVGLLGSFAAALASFLAYRARQSISSAARGLAARADGLNATLVEAGSGGDQAPGEK